MGRYVRDGECEVMCICHDEQMGPLQRSQKGEFGSLEGRPADGLDGSEKGALFMRAGQKPWHAKAVVAG